MFTTISHYLPFFTTMLKSLTKWPENQLLQWSEISWTKMSRKGVGLQLATKTFTHHFVDFKYPLHLSGHIQKSLYLEA